MNTLNIISFNANGLQAEVRRQRTLMWATHQRVDILMLQETHSTPNEESDWRHDWKGEIYLSHGTSNSRGVGILVAAHVNFNLLKEYTDTERRVVIIEIEINERKLTLCSSYGYNEDKPDFFQSVIDNLDLFDYESLIWGGDHNVVLNLLLDKKGGRFQTHEKCKNLLIAWKDEHEVDDVWRVQHPNALKFTWRSSKKPIVQSRLDFFLTSQNITTRVLKSNILPGFSSDHAAPQIMVDVKKPNSGKGFWKLNVSLLDNPEYCDTIIKCIEEVKKENPDTDGPLLWDTVKCKIRGASVKFSARVKRDRVNKLKTLENLLIKANDNLDLYPDNLFPDVYKVMKCKIATINQEIYDFIAIQTKGHIIRSRTTYYEEGEKNSKYFLGLEKRRGDSKSIKHLTKDDGTCTTDPIEILEEERKFYVNLYKSSRNDFSDPNITKGIFLEDLVIPQVPEEAKEALSAKFSEKDISQAIRLSPENKSPGTDGLGIEFYKKFWPHIKTLVCNSIDTSMQTGSMSISQKQGIISLIPKPGKDVSYLKNWRPISLLNQDYKLIARILAERCKQHLNDLISSDQNGFVPGRFIGLNIHRILNLIDLCEKNQINGLLLNIDFEKAFDCVEWDFIYTALKVFGFPEQYINYVKTLYNDISSCVINNGKFTKFFHLQRGVRQGCPLSTYLFVLGAEVLSLYIKQKGDIEGIKINGYNYLISQFADDTSLAIIGSELNLQKCFKVLNTFEEVSGLKVNVSKTEAMGLGTCSNPIKSSLNIKWVEDYTRVLGINVSRSKSTLISENYKTIISRLESRLKGWGKRRLSLLGKINILKCLGISQLVFLFTMLPTPGIDIIKTLETVLFNFIWNNGTERIKRCTLTCPLDLGGVNMVDIRLLKKSINISWIPRLVKKYNTWSSRIMLDVNIEPNEGNLRYIFRANLHSKDLTYWFKLSQDNPWLEILTDWCNYNYVIQNRAYLKNLVLDQTIWFNSHLRIGRRPVYYKTWYDKGLRYIADIVSGIRWKTIKEIESDFGFSPKLLDYLGILSSIPNQWRTIIRTQNDPYTKWEEPTNIDRLCELDKVSKTVYSELAYTAGEPPSERWHKWVKELNLDVSEFDWLDSIARIPRCTTSTRLQSLGYRFMIRDVLTNNRLIHMGKSDTKNCYICKLEIETISHLYWECPNNKRLWERLKQFINGELGIKINLGPMELLMGILENASDESPPDIINLLSLILKNYIHSCKCNNKLPTEDGLFKCITNTQSTELFIAQKKGRKALNNHNRKWLVLDI